MATGGLYGSTTTGDLVATSGAESTGLYGNNTNIGGTYFEWFIFYESTTAPATPTGGSWNFLTNTGTAPSGWSSTPPTNPTHTVWASISIVNSRSPAALTWTAPATWTQQGPTGTAATIAAGTTTTGAPGTSATVTNSGTSSAAVFNFQIPRGDVGATGATGATGTAATVAVGSTTTLTPGSAATVTNSGTNAAAVFNFGVPQGLTGATGATGATGPAGMNWRGDWSAGTFYSVDDGVFDAVSGSSYIAVATSTNQQPPNGSYWNLLAQKGANGSGVGTVTSVDVSGGTTGLTSFGGPITSSGTVTLAGTLNVANGGTGVTTSTGSGNNVLSTSPTLVTPILGTPTSGDFSTGTFTWPTFNQNTSGTALNVTGTVAIANGGTGATSAANALTNLGAIGAITSTDGSVTIGTTGTTRDLSVAVSASTNNVICQVRNTTGATLTKGTAVYISGATGQIPTVSKALATSDATSAQTLGLLTADLANNSNGNVTIIGLITDMNTSAYTDGAQLYLSGTTAGTLTATKQYAPIHLVYVAVVEYAHPTQGKLFVKVQNGYELDEIHNVSAQSPTTGQTIVYNSSTSLWEKSTSPVITGTTINSTTIGATTASTGAFTTLSASSTTTLSGGTANGVAYLNGSKVLTTGTALTFDGAKLSIQPGTVSTVGALASSAISIQNGSGAAGNLSQIGFGFTNSGTSTNVPAAIGFVTTSTSGFTNGDLYFATRSVTTDTAPTEQMRLTSTGLGIGTSSPASKLHVYNGSGTNASIIVKAENQYVNQTASFQTVSSVRTWDIGQNISDSSTGSLEFYDRTGAATRMRLDSAGNLGLGVTPSAWSTDYAVVQLPLGSAVIAYKVAGYPFTSIVSNAYYDGTNWKYVSATSAGATRFSSEGYNSDFVWYNAPTGTAGSNITFTSRMTLDSSGNLLVGTTSNVGSARVNVSFSGPSNDGVDIIDASNGSGSQFIAFRNSSGTAIGTITRVTTTNAVTYNTTSDYRLKDVVGAVSGSGERIDALEPVEYSWKSDGSHTRGFLAHKFQEVYASSVNGTKDAVDADGKPVYQSMQAGSSEVIADLVAEIQSLRKRLADAGIA